MIEALTPEQEQQLKAHYDRWFAVGSSCEPADRPRAEAAIGKMYQIIGKPAPRFIWCASPATSMMAIAILGDGHASLRDSLWDSLWDPLGKSLWASLRASLRDSLWDSLRESLWDSLGKSLWASLRASLRDSLWDSLRESLGESLGKSLGYSFYGGHEAYWISYYLFARDTLGAPYDPSRSAQLDLWSDLAQSCGWWWPYEGLCIISDRPESVSWEPDRNRPRLHSADGPALKFRDGYSVYAWRGVRAPKRMIEAPDSYTADEIRGIDNSELVRVLAERLGWDAFLGKLGATVIDTWRDPSTGLTYELLDTHRFAERQPRLLRMQSPTLLDGSAPQYIEKVPAAIQSAEAARYWQFMRPDGTWPSVDEANRKPQLQFTQEA